MQQKLTVEDVMELGAELRRQAIASATPEERLAGLTPEEMLALIQQIQVRLARQKSGKPGHDATETHG